MRGWYNIHDAENKRMGFVPFVGSSKAAPSVATTTPSEVMPGVTTGYGELTLVIAIIIGVAAVVTVTIVLLVIYCFQVLQLVAKAKKGSTKSDVSVGGRSTVEDTESAVALIIL